MKNSIKHDFMAAGSVVAALAVATCALQAPDTTKVRAEAETRIKQNKVTTAEDSVKKALESDETKLGSESPLVAEDLTLLGNIYLKQRKYVDAEQSFKRSKDIREKILKPGLLALTDSLNGLGLTYTAQGKLEDAG